MPNMGMDYYYCYHTYKYIKIYKHTVELYIYGIHQSFFMFCFVLFRFDFHYEQIQ